MKSEKITKAQAKKAMDAIGKAMREGFEKDRRETAYRLSQAKIVHDLGPHAHPELVEVLKALGKMIGATIVDAGFIAGESEGGMAFDFLVDGKTMRFVLGYNDLGEWVKCFTKISSSSVKQGEER